jgi:hypothetical protein
VRSRISSLPRIKFTILGLVAYRVYWIRPSSILSLSHIKFTILGLVAYRVCRILSLSHIKFIAYRVYRILSVVEKHVIRKTKRRSDTEANI